MIETVFIPLLIIGAQGCPIAPAYLTGQQYCYFEASERVTCNQSEKSCFEEGCFNCEDSELTDLDDLIIDNSIGLAWSKRNIFVPHGGNPLAACGQLKEPGWRIPTAVEFMSTLDFRDDPLTNWSLIRVCRYRPRQLRSAACGYHYALIDSASTQFVGISYEEGTATTTPGEGYVTCVKDLDGRNEKAFKLPEFQFINALGSWDEAAVRCSRLDAVNGQKWRIPTVKEAFAIRISSEMAPTESISVWTQNEAYTSSGLDILLNRNLGTDKFIVGFGGHRLIEISERSMKQGILCVN